PYAELAVQFALTSGQVNSDGAGSTAITLAKFAAKDLALAEDMVILQGARPPDLPPTVRVESGGGSLAHGLVGLAHSRVIPVGAPDLSTPMNSGGNILSAVARGVAMLTSDMQAPPFALILGTDAFATTWGSVINGAPAYNVLSAVLTGGIYGTGAMP